MTESDARDEGGEAAGTEPQQQFSCSSCCCLLVMVGVLGMALSLFIPHTHKRETPKPSCTLHLKQMGTALLMYVMDYDERLPAPRKWMDAVSLYLKNEDSFHCPTARKSDSGAYGYAFEQGVRGRLLAEIASHLTTPTVFDSTSTARNATGPFAATVCRPGRHDSGNYIGFVDGHVKHVKDTDLATLTPAGRTSAR
jgi:prepilin-type processing-associated H-X9-DG protein